MTSTLRNLDRRLLAGLLAGLLVAAGTAVGFAIADDDAPAAPAEEVGLEVVGWYPGTVSVELRNDSADPLIVRQVSINAAYVSFQGAKEPVAPGETASMVLDYPWEPGRAYAAALVTEDGGVLEYELAHEQRRHCDLVAVEFSAGDRHRPGRIELTLVTVPDRCELLASTLRGLVGVERVLSRGAVPGSSPSPRASALGASR